MTYERPARWLMAGSAFALVLLLASCSTEPMTPDECNVPLALVTPATATLGVGDTVLAVASLTGPPQCRPFGMTLRALRWMSTDSTVARVSAVKGYVVAKGAGVATISLYFPADSSTWGHLDVTVDP